MNARLYNKFKVTKIKNYLKVYREVSGGQHGRKETSIEFF